MGDATGARGAPLDFAAARALGPAAMRRAIRDGRWTRPTAGLCPGHLQANLVALPKALAFDFFLFCHRNPGPCPLLDVTDPGQVAPPLAAPDADLRTDVPRYRVYERGRLVAEPEDVRAWWRDDLVAFLLGCSFSFEDALERAGIRVRHRELGTNVPMYITARQCRPAGVFHGPLVVSMRPVPAARVPDAARVTAGFVRSHGAPVHAGAPEALGIADLGRPDFGDPVPVQPGEVPVFWACGVTPQAVAMAARPELMITHAPGHMFLTDLEESAG